MRWISHSNVTPVAASTRRRTSSPSPSDVRRRSRTGVDQEVAVLLRYLRAAARQASAAGGIDQFPGFHVRRIAERRTAGPRAHRLDASRAARISAMRAAITAASPRCAPQPRANHNGARRQSRMAIAKRQIGRGQPALLAGARHDLRPVEAGQRSRRRRRRRSSPPRRRSCRECPTGTPARSAQRPRQFRHRHIKRRRPGDDAIRFDGDGKKPRASRIITPGKPPSRMIRLEQHRSPAPACRVAKRAGTARGRSHRRAAPGIRRATDAEPGEWRQRRVGMHAAAQRRQLSTKPGMRRRPSWRTTVTPPLVPDARGRWPATPSVRPAAPQPIA